MLINRKLFSCQLESLVTQNRNRKEFSPFHIVETAYMYLQLTYLQFSYLENSSIQKITRNLEKKIIFAAKHFLTLIPIHGSLKWASKNTLSEAGMLPFFTVLRIHVPSCLAPATPSGWNTFCYFLYLFNSYCS